MKPKIYKLNGKYDMKIKLLLSAITILMLTGCTGTKVKITPEPMAFDQGVNRSYDSVGIRDIPSDKTYPATGNLTEAFSNEMRTSGFSEEVYYPFRPDDKTDITLDSHFTSEVDMHSGSMFAKSFFTGLTLFLIEPFIWYDFDYTLTGNLVVLKDGKESKRVSGQTEATISAKWLSLSELQSLEGKALSKAKKSLFQQLMHKIPN